MRDISGDTERAAAETGIKYSTGLPPLSSPPHVPGLTILIYKDQKMKNSNTEKFTRPCQLSYSTLYLEIGMNTILFYCIYVLLVQYIILLPA